MNQTVDSRALLQPIWDELMLLVGEKLQIFAAALENWINTRLQKPLPADWREQLARFLAVWDVKGYEVLPEHIRGLEDWIEAWASLRGVLPVNDCNQPPEEKSTQRVPVDTPGVGTAPILAAPIVLAGVVNAGGPPRGRLPKSEGKWIDGSPGNGTWKPSKPLTLKSGIIVDKVPYRNGKPILDKWSKGDVAIAAVGENGFDRGEAIRAWRAKGGGSLHDGYVFHHDGLTTEIIRYKGSDILVGRMQIVPDDLNRLLPHIGSARPARHIAGANKELAKKFAKEVNDAAIKGKGPLRRVAQRLAKVAKKIGRIIPLVGGLLVIIDFKENAEAHGLGGAMIRGAPLLGDLVTLYDVASDVADQMETDAHRKVQAGLEEANCANQQARQAAAANTSEAFAKIAQRLRVTNPYFNSATLKDPIVDYYETVRVLILLRLEGQRISYPEGMQVDDMTTESAFNLKLRIARDKLERDIKQQVEQPNRDDKRPDAI